MQKMDCCLSESELSRARCANSSRPSPSNANVEKFCVTFAASDEQGFGVCALARDGNVNRLYGHGFEPLDSDFHLKIHICTTPVF